MKPQSDFAHEAARPLLAWIPVFLFCSVSLWFVSCRSASSRLPMDDERFGPWREHEWNRAALAARGKFRGEEETLRFRCVFWIEGSERLRVEIYGATGQTKHLFWTDGSRFRLWWVSDSYYLEDDATPENFARLFGFRVAPDRLVELLARPPSEEVVETSKSSGERTRRIPDGQGGIVEAVYEIDESGESPYHRVSLRNTDLGFSLEFTLTKAAFLESGTAFVPGREPRDGIRLDWSQLEGEEALLFGQGS